MAHAPREARRGQLRIYRLILWTVLATMVASSCAAVVTTAHSASTASPAQSRNIETHGPEKKTEKPANSDPFGLAVGDQVQVIATSLNCRATPSTSGTIVSTESSGQLGQITNGSVSSGGYIWWYIAYTDGHTGWSAEGTGSTAWLQNVTSGSVAYNRTAAVLYAEDYWNKVTSDGYFWYSTGSYERLAKGTSVIGLSGDDCAHFVSQVVGNQANQSGGGLNIPSRVPPTYGEPAAGALGDLLINNGWATTVSSVSQLLAGDAINYEWASTDGGWDHIAVYLGNYTVAAHTTSHFGANWTLGGAYAYRFIHILNSSTVGGFSISSFGASPNPITVGHTTFLNTSAIGGTMPYTYSYTALPPGCTSSSIASLTCASSASGKFTIHVFVNDSAKHSATTTTTLTVTATTTTLSSITLSPTNPTITEGGTQTFSATPTCSATCPTSGISYTWTLTSSAMGSLTGSGVSMIFTAGSAAVTGGIFVNATLSGTTKGSSTVITVAAPVTLTSVSVSPTAPTVTLGGKQFFTATPKCSSTCSGTITYAWALTSSTVGTISPSSGMTTTFTAGTATGTVGLYVNATLGANTVSASTVITVTAAAVTLRSVSVAPASPSIPSSSTQGFTATPTCSATCPATGITYSWALTNTALGSLIGNGSSVNFTAGTTAITGGIFVNATLDSTTQGTYTVITVTVTPTNTLNSVSVSPIAPTVAQGGTQAFTATPSCSSTCPSGITYAWALTSGTLGSVSPSSGATTTFTAGSAAGTVGLYVNATLNGISKESSAEITVSQTSIPVLKSISVSPLNVTLSPDSTQVFSVSPTCSVGSCPNTVAYSWSLSNSLGALSQVTGASTTFAAGNATGQVTLTVTANLNGVYVSAMSFITISQPAHNGGFLTFSLSSWSTWLIIGCAVVVVGAVAAAVIARRHKGRASELYGSAQGLGGSAPGQSDLPDFPVDLPRS